MKKSTKLLIFNLICMIIVLSVAFIMENSTEKVQIIFTIIPIQAISTFLAIFYDKRGE